MGIFFSICSHRLSQKKDWPYAAYASVAAIEFDNEEESLSGSFLETLPPNPAHIEKATIKRALLNDSQVKEVHEATQGWHWPVDASTCHLPRHAFVFYGETGNLVGMIEVCFQCQGIKRHPAINDEIMYDLGRLREVFRSLGMSGHD